MSGKTHAQSTGQDVSKKSSCMDPCDQESRSQRIAELAYFKAEERGFSGDRALDDWLDAESEVDEESSVQSTSRSH